MKTHKKNKTLKNKCIFLFGYGSLMNDYSRMKTHKKHRKKYPTINRGPNLRTKPL